MEKVRKELNCEDYSTGEKLKVIIEGETQMPFWSHDLKIKAALTLLGSVDRKDYYEYGKEDLFYDQIEELKKTIEWLEI